MKIPRVWEGKRKKNAAYVWICLIMVILDHFLSNPITFFIRAISGNKKGTPLVMRKVPVICRLMGGGSVA